MEENYTKPDCDEYILPVRDALDILGGKWKLPIITSLSFGAKRFGQIASEIKGISDKVLSNELKDLEEHQLIRRTVYDTFPPNVAYEITPHGLSLEKVITELRNWGKIHRKKIIGK